jgi:transcriptional regulator with XRE-family HTH domain
MTDDDFIRIMRTASGVADVLCRLRELQQLTLQEVADLAGVSKAYVTRLEHGQRVPERDTLIALLLAAFSLPVSWANRILLLAGYAPLHHKMLARTA